MNLGNIFEAKLKEQSEKFVKWATLATDMLKNSKELKNDIMSLNELDIALDDLKKVSEPESQVLVQRVERVAPDRRQICRVD